MMNRFYGAVGFVADTDKGSSVWVQDPCERMYYGNVIRNRKQWEGAQQVNEDISVNNQISIVSDDYMCANMANIRYVRWGGAIWRVTSVEELRPRILLTLGGVYNGPVVQPAD